MFIQTDKYLHVHVNVCISHAKCTCLMIRLRVSIENLVSKKLHKHEKENESSPSLIWIVTKFNLCNLYSNSSKG